MKKYLLVFLVVLLGLGAGVAFLFSKSRKPVAPEGLPEPEGKLIETPLEERPYVTLTPRADGHELKLSLEGIKNTQIIEYELVYLSNNLSRGVIGTINLKGEKSISRDLLLGSCSRNVCKYDENVTTGTLTLRFRGPDGVRKFVTDFHLQKSEDKLTSVDGKFQLEAKFSRGVYFLTMNTVGLPVWLESEILAGPYAVFTSGSQVIKNGKVEISTESQNKVYQFDGKKWIEVGPTVSSLATFVAVEK